MIDGAPSWAGRYRDRLTGFEGEAAERSEDVAGSVQLNLVRLDNEGIPIEHWFDERRLERITEARPTKVGL